MDWKGSGCSALTLLTGCDISDHESVQRALAVISRFNDRVQAAIFGQAGWRRRLPRTTGCNWRG